MAKFKKISRFFYVVVAFSLGYIIVLGLSVLSEKSKGPLETLLGNANTLVKDIEQNIILEERENVRSKKLDWFKTVRDNKQELINSKIILLGASDASQQESYENIINLEDSLALSFPIIHIYQAWGERPEQQFPETEVNAIYQMGSIPMISWEPWLNDFTEENFVGIKEVSVRSKKSMVSVAKGNYDAYIKDWAKEAKKFKHPFYIRLGHEMNDPYRYPWGPQNNEPSDYVAAWRHIYNVFNELGVENVIWVWSPHIAYGHFKEYYPGDKYVDVVSTGVLNFGTSTTWSQWWSFKEIFGWHYQGLADFNKPIMISEFGSLQIGGDRAEWFRGALENFKQKYPLINSIVFFHYADDKTTSDKSVSWYIIDDHEVTTEIKKQLKMWDPLVRQPDIK